MINKDGLLIMSYIAKQEQKISYLLNFTNITIFYSMPEQSSIQMTVLRDKILEGVTQIQKEPCESEAVLFIGDTGVGKSTLLSYLIGHQLKVEEIGLKPCLVDCSQTKQDKVKIGHEKYSETSVPVRVKFESVAFYDCPGFNDNKSREDEIANSFYYQRLMSLYEKTKLVIVVDQSFLTESRAHRLPSLAKKLQSAFSSLQQIKYSTLFIVNKCDPDSDMEDLQKQLRKLISTIGMFSDQQISFFQHLIKNNQIYSFKQPKRCDIGKEVPPEQRICLLQKIKELDYVDKIEIKHIISDIAKLAIRDYLDLLSIQTTESVKKLMERISKQTLNVKTGHYQIKEQIIRVFDLKSRMEEGIDFSPFFDFCLQRKIKSEYLAILANQLQIVSFFSEVYSKQKTTSFYLNISSLILTNLSIILQKIDTMIEDQKLEAERKKRKQQRKKQEERLKALETSNKQNNIQAPKMKVKNAESVILNNHQIPRQSVIKNSGEQPVVLAFHRKLMTAELKIKQVSYGISEFHNKASNFTNLLDRLKE